MLKHNLRVLRVALLAVLLFVPVGVACADLVEFLAGSKVEGKIVARNDQSLTIETKIGEKTFTRKWPLDRIHAVTVGGKREVVNAKDGASGTGTQPKTKPAASGTGDAAAGGQRTRAEIDKLIDQFGRTPPDWWDSVPLNYPQTLDLSWPERPPDNKWNNQRNVNQYVWDVINTNPSKYREGVRLMHHLMSVNKDNGSVQYRAMIELGRMHFNLLQDFARAAFWWRKAGIDKDDRGGCGVHLAECYWRLGNKQMAMDQLDRADPHYGIVKLLAEMGEIRRALQLAESYARGGAPDVAYLYAGEACRVAGQYPQALEYYKKIMAVPATGQAQKRIERNQRRAQANIEAIQLNEGIDLSRVPDGTYRDSSLGYEDQVHVEVVVRGGRIESVRVAQHREKQYYSAMTETPRKIVAKQSVKGVDATSSATITAEAIINATAKALSKAMR